MIYKTLSYLAFLLTISGFIPYIITTVQHKTHPSRTSWIIWTLVGGILFFNYWSVGDTNTIWLPLAFFLGPLIIAILSIPYGHPGWRTIDKICLCLAILSIIPWILLQLASMTMIINIIIDFLGALPTLVKSYHFPQSENRKAWLLFFFGNIINLFAISHWTFACIYPIYLFILSSVILAILIFRKPKLPTK